MLLLQLGNLIRELSNIRTITSFGKMILVVTNIVEDTNIYHR